MHVDNKPSLLVENKKAEDFLENEKSIVDMPYKVSLIANEIRNNKKLLKNYLDISNGILFKTGIFISPEECGDISKKYPFLISKSNRLSLFLTVLFVVGICTFSFHNSTVGIIFTLLLSPLIFNFFNEAAVGIQLRKLNPNDMKPSIDLRVEFLKTTAVILASRNEPFAVAKMTFDSAMELTYPDNKKEIIVVDNSDTSFEDYLEWKNYVESYSEGGAKHIEGTRVIFIHRDGVEGFKPRNLDIALSKVTSEFILYLDIDSTVQPDTLLRIIPIFNRDKNLGFVQLYTSPTNFSGASSLGFIQCLRNFYLRFVTVVNAHASHSLFYGHNAIWRTEAVREIGDCLEYHRNEVVVTEDLSMSFRARFKGYYGTGAWLESGEWIPESLRETEAMWLRWTVGTYQVYEKHFTSIDNLKKMTWLELLGWFQHLGFLVNYGLVPIYAIVAIIFNSSILMWMVAFSLLPEIAQAVCAYLKLSLGNAGKVKKMIACYSAFLILGTFINWVKCIGLVRYLMKTKQGWRPTGKSPEHKISSAQVIKDRFSFILSGLFIFVGSSYLLWNLEYDLINTLLLLVCGIYGFNSLLAVILFGKSSMQENATDAVASGNINAAAGFYLKEE